MRKIWQRLLVASAVGAVGVWVVWRLREEGPQGLLMVQGCRLREWTGLCCPGCGMTRAAAAVLHGRVAEALALNPLGVVLGPVVVAALAPWMVSWITQRPVRWRAPVGRKMSVILVVLVLAFWVARNLPWWPWPV